VKYSAGDSADDAAHTTFVRLRRSRSDAASEELVLSRAAMHLHTFGVLSSIEAGSPGFVSDCYLSAISAETSITALELCLTGLWERTACGYRVSDADTLSVAEQIHGQLHDLAARCLRNGGHITDPQHPDVCAKCGSTLQDEYRPRHGGLGEASPSSAQDGSGERADAA
jgi:hypothetical protein